MTRPRWPAPAGETRWVLRLPNWIGDAVQVLPALRALPRRGQRWLGVAHPRTLPLYRALAGFEEVLAARGGRAPIDLARRLRAFAPHRALVFTEPWSGAVLAVASGAPARMGRGSAWRGGWLTHRLPRGSRTRPLWRQHLELAEAAGGRAPARPDFRLDPGDQARERAEALLPEGTSPVALAPGAAYGPAKRWPLERFAQVARDLAARGIESVTVGTPAEREAGVALAAAGARDLTGKTGLLEGIAVLERCRAVVSNDSGAMHLARAAGSPVVALFGSSSPSWTGPEPHEGRVVRHEVECSPCFRRTCPYRGEDHLRCLRGVETPQVLAALDALESDGAA